VRLAQHVAAAPHGFDEVAAFGGLGELLAQLADEDVDDLRYASVRMVRRRATQRLEQLIRLLTGG
jgi:hypothetical protein